MPKLIGVIFEYDDHTEWLNDADAVATWKEWHDSVIQSAHAHGVYYRGEPLPWKSLPGSCSCPPGWHDSNDNGEPINKGHKELD